MTKKDYEVLALAIRSQVELMKSADVNSLAISAVEGTTIRIAAALQQEDDKFDYTKFMNACGFK